MCGAIVEQQNTAVPLLGAQRAAHKNDIEGSVPN